MSRIDRAAAAAASAGLAGLLVTPGPDLQYLTGYSPLSAAERLMVLVVRPGEEPVLVLPGFERGDAPDGLRYVEWSDGQDAYAAAAALLGPGRYAVSDAAWALHVLALLKAAPGSELESMSAARTAPTRTTGRARG